MLIRLRYGRRVQGYLKLIACALVAVFYFTFLFRESLNAYEQNKERMANAGIPLGANGINNKKEIKTAPKLSRIVRQQKQQQQQLQQQLHQQQQQRTTQPTSAHSLPTAPSTLNPVYEYSEEIHSATEKDLQQRKEHLNVICKRYNLESHYPPNPWEFFISPGHSLVWCNVFKAASSTWMYYFNILGGYDLQFLQRTESQPLELARKRFPRPEMHELLDSLTSALSFLFVRDPFERIVSAYRNKLEGGRNSFYKGLAQKIIHQFRKYPAPAQGLHIPRSGPTFEEFLRYLIEQHATNKRFDEHWAPVYSFCTPCSVNFTIIGKVETFQRDSEFIIRQAGLESLLLGKLPKHKLRKIGNLASGIKSQALVERYFSDIARETLDQLLKIYRLDFELFDYNYTKYYEAVKPAALSAAADSTIRQLNADNSTLTTTSSTTTRAINKANLK